MIALTYDFKQFVPTKDYKKISGREKNIKGNR